MPKKVFWPATILTMGLIFFATQMKIIPEAYSSLWALIMIVTGLVGLITSDRVEWLCEPKLKKTSKKRRSSKKKK